MTSHNFEVLGTSNSSHSQQNMPLHISPKDDSNLNLQSGDPSRPTPPCTKTGMRIICPLLGGGGWGRDQNKYILALPCPIPALLAHTQYYNAHPNLPLLSSSIFFNYIIDFIIFTKNIYIIRGGAGTGMEIEWGWNGDKDLSFPMRQGWK